MNSQNFGENRIISA